MTSVLRQEKLKESTPHDSERVASPEVRDAIQSAYPLDDGLMVAKLVSSRHGTSWYRVNWYRNGSGGLFIDRSRFVAVSKTQDGQLKVEDQTIRTPSSASFVSN